MVVQIKCSCGALFYFEDEKNFTMRECVDGDPNLCAVDPIDMKMFLADYRAKQWMDNHVCTKREKLEVLTHAHD
jgi:hypothetical protein